MNEFNYCVARYWDNDAGAISAYAYGSEIFYGDLSSAEAFLKYVKSKSPDKKWKIFKITELNGVQ